MAAPDDAVAKLYNALKTKAGMSEADLGGSVDDFRKKMSNKGVRDAFYDYVSYQYPAFKIGSKDVYMQRLGEAYTATPPSGAEQNRAEPKAEQKPTAPKATKTVTTQPSGAEQNQAEETKTGTTPPSGAEQNQAEATQTTATPPSGAERNQAKPKEPQKPFLPSMLERPAEKPKPWLQSVAEQIEVKKYKGPGGEMLRKADEQRALDELTGKGEYVPPMDEREKDKWRAQYALAHGIGGGEGIEGQGDKARAAMSGELAKDESKRVDNRLMGMAMSTGVPEADVQDPLEEALFNATATEEQKKRYAQAKAKEDFERRNALMAEREMQDILNSINVEDIVNKNWEKASEAQLNRSREYVNMVATTDLSSSAAGAFFEGEEAREQTADPNKVYQAIRKRFDDPKIQKAIASAAGKQGMSVDRYMSTYLMPAVMGDANQRMFNLRAPKSTAEYVKQTALQTSIIGKLSRLNLSKESKELADAALQSYDPNAGEWFLGFAGGLAVDAPIFIMTEGIGTYASMGTRSMLLARSAEKASLAAAGATEAVATDIASRISSKWGINLATRIAGSSANFATFESVGSVVDQMYRDGKVDLGTTAASTLKGAFMGALMGTAGYGVHEAGQKFNLFMEDTAKRLGGGAKAQWAGRMTADVLTYGTDLNARSLVMAGTNALVYSLNGDPNWKDGKITFGDLYQDALKTNLAFDIVGVAKRLAKDPKSIKAMTMALRDPSTHFSAEALESFRRAGIDCSDTYSLLAKLIKMSRSLAEEGTVGKDGEVSFDAAKFDAKMLPELMKVLSSNHITNEDRNKAMWFLTGMSFSMPPTTKALVVEEDGRFVVVEKSTPEVVNRRVYFDNKEAAIKHAEKVEEEGAMINALKLGIESMNQTFMGEVYGLSIALERSGVGEAKKCAEVIAKVQLGGSLSSEEEALANKIEKVVNADASLRELMTKHNPFLLLRQYAETYGLSFNALYNIYKEGLTPEEYRTLRDTNPALYEAVTELRKDVEDRMGYTEEYNRVEIFEQQDRASGKTRLDEEAEMDAARESVRGEEKDPFDEAAVEAYEAGATEGVNATPPSGAEQNSFGGYNVAEVGRSLRERGAGDFCDQLERLAKDYEGTRGVPQEVRELLDNITEDQLRSELEGYYLELVRAKGAEDAPEVVRSEAVEQLYQQWADLGLIDSEGCVQEGIITDPMTNTFEEVFIKPGQDMEADIIWVVGDTGLLQAVNRESLEVFPIAVDAYAVAEYMTQQGLAESGVPVGGAGAQIVGGTTPPSGEAQGPTEGAEQHVEGVGAPQGETTTPPSGEAQGPTEGAERPVGGVGAPQGETTTPPSGEAQGPTEERTEPQVTMLPNGLQIDNATGDPVIKADTKPSAVAEYYLSKTELPANVVDGLVGAKIAEAQRAFDDANAAEEPQPTSAGVNDYVARHGEWESAKQNASDNLNFWLNVRTEIGKQRAAQQPQIFGDGDVPDVSMDTPAAARERGYIMQNGVRIDRPGLIRGTGGKTVDVPFSTQDGGTATAQYILAPISSVVPSHREGQPVMEHFFISEGQPKNRTDAASVNAARNIARNVNESILKGGSAYEGAPVITKRGEVIQGNNRQRALELLPGANTYEHYRQMLKDNAAEFGFTPEHIDAMPDGFGLYRLADVTDEQAVKLGNYGREDLESGGVQQINPVTASEMLRQSDRVGGFLKVLLNDPEGDTSIYGLIKANGVEALKAAHAAGAINDTQYANAVQDGKLTDMARIQLDKILTNLIVGNGSPQMKAAFEGLAEKKQDAIISIFSMDSNAEPNSQLWADVQAALELQGYGMHSAVFAGASTVEDARRGLNLVLTMPEAYDKSQPKFTPLQIELAAMIKGGKAKDLLDAMKQYYEAVRPKEAGLFETEVALTKDEAIKQIFGVSNERQAQQGNGGVAGPSNSEGLRGGTLQGGDRGGRPSSGEGGETEHPSAGTGLAGPNRGVKKYTEGDPDELVNDPSAIVDLTKTQLLAGGIHTLEDLKQVFNTLNGNSDLSLLFNKVLDTSKLIGLDRIVLSGKLGSGSSTTVATYRLSYDTRTPDAPIHTLTLSKSGMQRMDTNQAKASDILHEMIHHVSLFAIDLRNGILPKEMAEKIPEHVRKRMIEGAQKLDGIFEAIKRDPRFNGQYGVHNNFGSTQRDVHRDAAEMVAELSDPKFRQILKEKDLWVQTIDAFTNFFDHEAEGAEKSDALTETEKALEICMEAWNGRPMAGEATPPSVVEPNRGQGGEPSGVEPNRGQGNGLLTVEQIKSVGLDPMTEGLAIKYVEKMAENPDFESDYLQGMYEAARAEWEAKNPREGKRPTLGETATLPSGAEQNQTQGEGAQPGTTPPSGAEQNQVQGEGAQPGTTPPSGAEQNRAGGADNAAPKMGSVAEETAKADAEINDLLAQIEALDERNKAVDERSKKLDEEKDIEKYAEQLVDIRKQQKTDSTALRALKAKLSVALGKAGYQLVRGGETNSDKWMESMRAKYGEALKKALKFDDAKVERYLLDVKEYTVVPSEKGEMMTIAEHLSAASAENTPKGAEVSTERTNFVIEVAGRLKEQLEEAIREAAAETLGYPSMPPARLNINALRAMAEKNGWKPKNDVQMQEAVEQAIVAVAREIVLRNANNPKLAYDNIVRLYELQPTISMRSSNRIELQQYSTPTPMGYMADLWAMKNGAQSVLEPTAGNGMMLIGIDPSIVHVNEIDPERLSVLQQQGYGKVTNQDGREPFSPKEYDAVVMNPPFGSSVAKMYGEFRIGGLDPQIVVNALESMKDDGRAAIIVGGNNEYDDYGRLKGSYAPFLRYLYTNYKVDGILNMAGSLYQRQGTTYPTRMILISGRRTHGVGAVPRLGKNTANLINNWNQLYESIDNLLHNGATRLGGDGESIQSGESPSNGGSPLPNNGAVRGGESGVRGGDGAGGTAGVPGQESGRTDAVLPGQLRGGVQPTSQQDADTGRPTEVGTSMDADGGLRVPDAGPSGSRNGGDRGGSDLPDRGHSPRPDADAREGAGLPGGERNGTLVSTQGLNGESTLETEGISEPVRPRVAEPEKISLEQERTKYPQRSAGKAIDGCIVPAGMATHVAKALNALGDVDQMVMDELGYDSKDALYNAFYGPQIDAIAMAVSQLKKGSGMIIGDGTGMGKGRQASAIVRWAVKQGKTPVYITEKPKLFTDNRRDMIGIGSGDLRPLVIGSKDVLDEKTGEVVFKVATDAELNDAIRELALTGKLPSRYNYVLTTYSQIQGGTMEYAGDLKKARSMGNKSASALSAARSAQKKRDFLESLLRDNYVILDESHNAAGDGGGSAFIQYCLPKTAGAVYLSATFAKRPDCLPLYALKTSMSDANIPADKMIAAIEAGGTVLEEVLSETLVQNGQYIRRDRDKGNTKHEWITLEDKEGQTRQLYDRTIELFNDIIDFQDAFIKPLVDSMNETGDDIVGQTRGTEDLGVQNTPFASRTFNTVRQLLLALKADDISSSVIEACNNDQRPVIALGNTMEGAVEDLLEENVDSDAPDFAEVFRKGLDSIFSLQRKDPNNPKNTVVESIPLSMLSPEGQVAYRELQQKMDAAFIGLPLSPLDYIVHKLEDAGLRVGEYTGRKHKLIYNSDGTVRWTKRTSADRDQNLLVDGFNSGAIDVLIINESGSTGLSLHAHQDFPDTRQRVLFTVQPLLDISKYMQMLGRVDRLGQIVSPILYDISAAIPAEQRLMMMMKNKLASLNANTTSNQKNSDTEVDVVDFLNKYGNQVVTQLLKDNTELNEKLRDPLDLMGEAEDGNSEKPKVPQNAASKVSSRVALLSVEDQELFYSEMSKRYNEFVERLKDEGEYDLEASTQPLKATTLSRSVFVEGKDNNSDNVFAQSSYLEVCEVDVLKRPMKSREVESLMKSLTDGKSAAEHKESVLADLDEANAADLSEALRKIAEQKKTAIEAIRTTRPEKIRAKKPDITDAELNEIIEEEVRIKTEFYDGKEESARKRLEAMYGDAQRFVFNMPVGKGVNVATLTQKDATVNSPGILVGYRRTGKKMIPSAVYAVFALHDGRRKIEVPLSDKRNLQAILQGRTNDFTARDLTLDNWDSNISNAARKTAYIVTNNLLQGYGAIPNQAGVITRYTDSEGNVKTGIVLPNNFDFTKLRPQKSIVTAKGLLQQGEIIKTSEGDMDLQIVRDGGQTYVAVSVSGSKKKGGKYYLDDGLRKFMDDNNFNKRGGKMVGLASTANLDQLLNYLDKKFHITYSSESDLDTRAKRIADKTDDYAWAEEFVDQRSKRSDELDKEYPGWNEGSTKDSGGDNTQVTNTVGTYKKVGQWVLDNGTKGAKVLDASSGLGLGSVEMRKMGLDVDDVEPYPDKKRQVPPSFKSYEDIDKEYDLVISNAVLNVIPDDWRENVMKQMAAVVKPGGKLFINTRSKPEALNTKNKIELDDEYELLVLNPDGSYRHYQKFSDVPELISWAQMQLGPGWKVERATKKNIGFSNACSILCTKIDPRAKKITDKTDDYAWTEEFVDQRNKEYGTGEALSTDPDVEVMRNEVNFTREDYDTRLMSEMHQFAEVWLDDSWSVKTAQELMEKQLGRRLYASENAHEYANQMHSINMAECDNFMHNFYEPLMKECARLRKAFGVELEDLERYLIAKSGLERNVVLAERDALNKLPKAFEAAKEKTQAQIDGYIQNLARMQALPSPTPTEKAWIARYPAMISNLKAYLGSKKQEDDVYNDLLARYRKKDYSGLTSLTGMDEVADAEDAARVMAANLEADCDTSELWYLINRATRFGLDKTHDVGRISQKTYDRVSTMMQYYIPLRGWDESTAEDMYSYEGTMRSGIAPTVKTAKGRRSLAESPLAVIGSMGVNSVIQGNKNVLFQHVLNLAQHANTDLLSVSELYVKYNDVTDEWESVYPDLSKVKDEDVKGYLEQWEQDMENNILNDPDHYAKASERPDIPYRISKTDLPTHQMIAFRNGKPYTITVNGNPRFAKALKGEMRHSRANGPMLRVLSKATKAMTAFMTTYSPQFIMNNPSRDLQTSTVNNAIRGGAAYSAGFVGMWITNFPKMRGLYHAYRDGRLDMSYPRHRYFKEYIDNGGQTGFAMSLRVEDAKKMIEKAYFDATCMYARHPMTKLERNNAIKRATWYAERGFHSTVEFLIKHHINWLAKPVKVPIGFIGALLADCNKYMENLTRFSTYMMSRLTGKNIQDSIKDAKEITGNYNTHGAGATMANETTASWFTKGNAHLAQWMYATSPFVNAAIQSADTVFRQNMNHKRSLVGGILGSTFMGMLVSMLWRAFSDDDEKNKYLEIPEYERRNKLCIPIGNNQYIGIPLGYNYRSCWALGDIAAEMYFGDTDKSRSDYAKEILHAFASMSPVYFLEGDSPDENSNMLGATAKKTLMPGVIKPLWEVHNNKKWNGAPVHNSSPYMEKDPEYMRGFRTTDQDLVDASKWAYDATREDRLGSKGSINLNPADVEYLLSSYLGGPFKELMRDKRFVESLIGDEEFKMRNVPMVGNFFREIDTSRGGRKESTYWYKHRDLAERIKTDLKSKSADERKRYEGSPEYKWYNKWRAYENAYNRLGTAYKKSGNEELRERMDSLMKVMNDFTRQELGY